MQRLSNSLLRTLQRQNRPWVTRCNSSSSSETGTITEQNQKTSGGGQQSPHTRPADGVEEQQASKLATRQPLAKNFCVGIVDKELLGYPEVVTREEMGNLQNALLPLKTYFAEATDASSSTSNLKQLGLYGLNVPTDYEGGRGYGLSASLMASEPEATDTSLALGLVGHRVVVDLISSSCSLSQQQRYLPALAAGDLVATEAIFEYSPPEDEYFNTTATLNADTNKWELSGNKAFVVCTPGEKQLFLVLAQTRQPNVTGDLGRNTSLFLVESEQTGVRLGDKPHETFGCRDTTQHIVHFDKVELTDQNIVGLPYDGNQLSELLMRSSRLRGAIPVAALAKRALNELAQYCVDTKQCGIHVKDLELPRSQLAKSMSVTYAMDSMIYLTAGLADEFHKQDITLECAITKYYALKHLYEIASHSLSMIGPKALHSDQQWQQILRDAAQLCTQGESLQTLSMFIALSGLQHAGQMMNQTVHKSRNPLFHPGHIFRKFFDTNSIDTPKTNMSLGDNVHPSLAASAQCIEQSVARLEMAVELMFTRYGNEVVERQNDMLRLADAVSTIYAMFASVARASRSYCIGLSLADYEMLTATTICAKGRDDVKQLCTDIYGGHFVNNDNNLLRLANQVTKSKGHFAVHPLTFNF